MMFHRTKDTSGGDATVKLQDGNYLTRPPDKLVCSLMVSVKT